jgi:hypothetical protein
VTWLAKKELTSTDHLVAELWTRTAGSTEPKTRGPELMIPMRFVRPLRLEPESITQTGQTVGIVDQESYKETGFVCWSSTLSHFRLEARTDNPCVVATCRPLTEAEIGRLSKQRDTAVLSGYVVEVVVYERRDGKQLDLGPFHHAVRLTSPDVPEADAFSEIYISGTVHGDVTVTSSAPTGKNELVTDLIALGTFRADRARSLTATVEAAKPGIAVVFDWLEPAAIQELLDVKFVARSAEFADGRPSWDLRVTIPANRLQGPLPEHSAILLKVMGSPPRLIRIPITGRAYTALRGH